MNGISSVKVNKVLPWQQSHVLVNVRQGRVDQWDEGIFGWAIGISRLFVNFSVGHAMPLGF